MCVWSAYAGKKQAAPLMLEALKKIEGYWAGFYTGLVTCDNNQLHWKKCIGHTGIFEETFDLSDLPGTWGLAHSRTGSGGGENRAHPFIGTEGKVALVSQGSIGLFGDKFGRSGEKALELYNAGRRLRSGSSTDGMRPRPELIMPDGNQVSFSDVVVNLIEAEYSASGDIIKAMRSASGYLLEESSSICVFADKPGVLGFINMNQRVGYSFEEDGVYMGITGEAFPGTFMEIPGNSVGYVTADGELHLEALGDFHIKSSMPEGMVSAAIDYLKANPGAGLAHICDNAIRPCGFVQGELDYHAVAAYRVLETLIAADMVRYEICDIPGVKEIPGRIFKWYLK